LLAAYAFGYLPVVKFLVRAGAKLVSTKGARPFSAVEAARSFPKIIQWPLVDRHIEQPRIELFSNGMEEQEVRTWSGVQCVKVETAGLYSQISDGSSFDHAKELAKLRRRLQGEAVYVVDEPEDQSAEL
jgi:hypothetical protein